MNLLKLDNQLCFPIYALSRQITGLYRPLLEKIDLTYPQYLVMLLLWEHHKLSVKEIGEHLKLDSGTLTPLLKRLEKKELLTRKRDEQDERLVQIYLSPTGENLKVQAKEIPVQLDKQLHLGVDEGKQLAKQLRTILNTLS